LKLRSAAARRKLGGHGILMNTHRGVIAVVEDDHSLKLAVSRLLVAAGFDVRTFDTAEALLASSSMNEAVCVVADIELPGMSGLDLCHKLRGKERDVACVLITAYDDMEYRSAAMAIASAFLTKPFSSVAFIEAVVRSISHA
jgi:FixJ family two-component response regulator